MKQTTKNILGVAAIVLLSSGVGGYTAYKLLSKERVANATFNELFPQNPASNVRLAAFSAVDAQPVDLTQAAETSVHAVVHIRATQLGRTEIQAIARRMLERVGERMRALGVTLRFTDAALAVLADQGFDPDYGARPLRRTIRAQVEDVAAEKLLSGAVQAGDTVLVDGSEGALRLEIPPAAVQALHEDPVFSHGDKILPVVHAEKPLYGFPCRLEAHVLILLRLIDGTDDGLPHRAHSVPVGQHGNGISLEMFRMDGFQDVRYAALVFRRDPDHLFLHIQTHKRIFSRRRQRKQPLDFRGNQVTDLLPQFRLVDAAVPGKRRDHSGNGSL